MDQYLDRLEERAAQRERATVEAEATERDKMRVYNLHEMGLSPEKIAKGMDIDLSVVKEWLAAPAMA